MHKANMVRRREIGAHIWNDAQNVWPWMEGKRYLGNILHIKFFHANIKQCEGEE
jgi:hypothetical protein